MLGAILLVIVVGALVSRDFPRAGLVLTLLALGVYILRGLPSAVRCLGHFKVADTGLRLRTAREALMLVLAVSAAVSGDVWYFPILALLALDYITEDKKVSK